MYKIKATIKCPAALAGGLKRCLTDAGVVNIFEESVPFGKFILESRLYWDFVFPEMLTAEDDVAYLSYEFDDSAAGRGFSHDIELKLGWIPQNLRYITVDD